MIEVREAQNKENETIYQLFLNGEHVEGLIVEKKRSGGFELSYEGYDFEPMKKIKFSDLPNAQIKIFYIEIEAPYADFFTPSVLDLDTMVMKHKILGRGGREKLAQSNLFSPHIFAEIEVKDFKKDKMLLIEFFTLGHTESWKKPFSFGEYQYFYLNNLKQIFPDNFELEIGKLIFKFELTGFIGDVIQELKDGIFKAHEKTMEQITDILSKDSFTFTLTDFPAEYRTSCIQYLQYFADFLTDLGVKAKTAVIPEDDYTLLKVTPEDKTISLQKIHDALEIYLELPKSSQVYAENENNKLRELKYIQQVRDLEAKLTTTQIQMGYEKALADKDKTIIQMLALFNDSLLEDKAKLKEKEDNKKEIGKGIIKLGKIKFKDGVEIDLVRFLEVTKLDVIFDQLEEYLTKEDVVQLKLSE